MKLRKRRSHREQALELRARVEAEGGQFRIVAGALAQEFGFGAPTPGAGEVVQRELAAVGIAIDGDLSKARPAEPVGLYLTAEDAAEPEPVVEESAPSTEPEPEEAGE